MDGTLLDPFNRLLEQVCPPAAVRQFEADGDGRAIWSALVDSGFVEALISEGDGGPGLAPADMAPLLLAAGRHLLPVAFGDTMVARALAAAAGAPLPVDTPVLLWPVGPEGRLRSVTAPARAGATHALVQQGLRATLLPLAASVDRDGFGIAAAVLDMQATPTLAFDLPEDRLLHWSAALLAATMAGAMGRVLDMTLAHVNDRQQFGRPLAKFQAIQQQVSVMAEHVAAANVAARMALARPMPGPDGPGAAIGKIVANDAAASVCAIAHAAHGAIGITAEHDLPLYARRLKRWQTSFGSGPFWTARLGAARIAANGRSSVDFFRAIAPTEA